MSEEHQKFLNELIDEHKALQNTHNQLLISINKIYSDFIELREQQKKAAKFGSIREIRQANKQAKVLEIYLLSLIK